MAARKHSRGLSPHPGVILVRPSSDRTAWRLRFKDPDTGRDAYERLDPIAFRTERARIEAARRKSNELAQRRLELIDGGPRKSGASVEDGVERFFRDNPQLRERTQEVYREAAGKLIEWCERERVRTLDDLSRGHLLRFRAMLIAEPISVPVVGGRKGDKQPGDRPRAAHTINKEIRAVARILTHLRIAELLPQLSGDDISDALARLRGEQNTIVFFSQSEIRDLLEAALAHDRATFRLTRAEKSMGLGGGETRRYAPVAPMVFAALATGMRFGELASLTWGQVNLDAIGDDGEPVGEIRLFGSGVKTGRGRVIDLAVSPALRSILNVMRDARKRHHADLVFGLSPDEANAAGKRMTASFGAPLGSPWQKCRRTCGTYLTNAPGIFGAASAYRSARQLGHSVVVAERNYVGVVRGIPRHARTIESAMGIEDLAAEIEEDQRSRPR